MMELAEAEARIAINKNDIDALVAKADHFARSAQNGPASNFYLAAFSAGRVNPHPLLPHVQDMLQRLAGEFRRGILDGLEARGLATANQPERFAKALRIMLGEEGAGNTPSFKRPFPQQPTSFFYPDLPEGCYFDPAQFEWASAVEALAPQMIAEAQTLLANGADFRPYMEERNDRPQIDAHGLLENPDWSTLHFWRDGSTVQENCAHFPSIAKAIEEVIPLCHVGVRAPSVMLSLLKAGARIPPHTGMINTRLICHLPLIVPPNCGFRVGNETREWEVGKLLIFDDTIEHEAWNKSHEDRLILIFDVWKPELSETERTSVRALFDAVDNDPGRCVID